VQFVSHLGWVDLGVVDAGQGKQVATVRAVGRTPFALISVNSSPDSPATRVSVADLDSPASIVAVRQLRFRLVVDAPVGFRESLARLVFFPTAGGVLPLCTGLAIAGLAAGWWLLGRKRLHVATVVLSVSVLTLHGALLPPLMGGDETSHAPTIETRLFPAPPELGNFYPASIGLAAQGLELERIPHRGDETIPVRSAEERRRMRELLALDLADEARAAGTAAPWAWTIDARTRAIAYYQAVASLSRHVRDDSIIDRLSWYRLVGVAVVGCLFALGAALLRWTGAGAGNAVGAGIVLLIPYSVAVVASISNYSPAIGFGLLGAIGLVAGVVGRSPGRRVAAAVTGLSTLVAGVLVWSDFALGIAILLPVLPLLVALAVTARRRGGPGLLGLGLGGAALAAAAGLATAGGEIVEKLATALPRARFALEALWRPDLQERISYAAFPLVLLLAGLLFVRLVSSASRGGALRIARVSSGFLAVLFVGGSLALPYTSIPSGYVQPSRAVQLGLFLRSMASNAFSWDQDFLGWKAWWGVFGWLDAPSHPFVYAVARWALSALVIASPLLVLPFVRRRPQQAAMLLTVSCFSLIAVAISFLIRLNGTVFPYGRFFLPFFPLVLLPLLAMLLAPGRAGKLMVVFGVAVLFHVWVAVYTLGTRYYLGSW